MLTLLYIIYHKINWQAIKKRSTQTLKIEYEIVYGVHDVYNNWAKSKGLPAPETKSQDGDFLRLVSPKGFYWFEQDNQYELPLPRGTHQPR